MDWACDNAQLSEKDLGNVFKYEEKSTTVVLMLSGEKEPMIWSLNGDHEWEEWLTKRRPLLDGTASGLVLILAKRTGELSFPSVKKVASDDWRERINAAMPSRSNTQRTMIFASTGEKGETTIPNQTGKSSGQRSLRTLPFSKDLFRLITNRFYIHGSIAKVISRADIPVFSNARIRMQDESGTTHPAYVYNCRTSNAWDTDLALTATYFPHCGLTFAVLFGCPLSIEEEVLRRLSFAMAEAAHPLLMPGIFTELERSRQVHIIEATIDELETRILQLDFQSSDMEQMPASEAETRNQEKRTAWLDTTYLRNTLISWNTQQAKICRHVDELSSKVFKPSSSKGPSACCDIDVDTNLVVESNRNFKLNETRPSKAPYDGTINDPDIEMNDDIQLYEEEFDGSRNTQKDKQRDRILTVQEEAEETKARLRQTGQKIKDRIQGIIDEYDDKIRDCTMRVDGMAMTTQWSHGETNVQIALATGRDSRHMRSIALVTMIFLPGTFFATVFSMTFFNWFGAGGEVVSPYFYIYVIFTVFFTLLTLGSWWYFVSYRHSRGQNTSLEEEIPLV